MRTLNNKIYIYSFNCPICLSRLNVIFRYCESIRADVGFCIECSHPAIIQRRLNTLPDEDGTLAIKKFEEYNTTIEQTGGSSPILQGDEISTNAAVTFSFNRAAQGIYEVLLSSVTTKIVASATSCAALTTGNPYLVIVKKLNTTTVQLTVLDAIGLPTDDWEFLNITIKYTI